MIFIAILGSLALLLLLLAGAGQHDQAQILARWEFRLNPEGLRVYDDVAREILWNREMIETSYEDAGRAHRRQDIAETLRFLDLAARIVADCSPSFLGLLVNIGDLARHAEAIAPLPPMSLREYRLRRAGILAGFHIVAHHARVTSRDRLRLRLAVLRVVFRAVTGSLLRATHVIRLDPERPWTRIEAARADLGTLTDESLETLRTVLASLAAVRRPAPAKETA